MQSLCGAATAGIVHRMSVQVTCAGCGGRLEVDSQYAGQTASCPICKSQFTVPGEEQTETAQENAPEPPVWSMKTPEGRIYGPVTRTDLDLWVSEGRVAEDCELRETERGEWTAADAVYAVLRPGVAVASSRGNPFAPASFYHVSSAAHPGTADPAVAETPTKYLAPHRGGLILALGIMAFVVACPLLSFLAWAMGTNDLREMREGRMDPSGMNMTQAGMVLGMLLSVGTIIVLVGLVFYVLFTAAL
jgi:hypothetical protein